MNMKNIIRNTYIELAKDAITNNLSLWLKVSGRSMSPTIKSGEKILIKLVELEQIKIGDIVVYKTNDKLISHRIIFIGHLRFTIKGDSELVWRSCDYNSILGKIVSIEKHDGRIINLETRTWRVMNYIIAIYSLSTGLFYQKLCSIKRTLSRKKKIHFINFISKTIRISIFFPLKLFINFIFVAQKLKSKL